MDIRSIRSIRQLRRFGRLGIVFGIVFGILFSISAAPVPTFAATDSAPQVTIRDLAWLVMGLDDLSNTQDAKLAITAQQARTLFDELKALREEGILRFSFAGGGDAANLQGRIQRFAGAARNWSGASGTSGGSESGSGAVTSGGPTALSGFQGGGSGSGGQVGGNASAMGERMQERNDQMNRAMDTVLMTLSSKQCDYILNMDVDLSQFGLDRSSNRQGTEGGSSWNPQDIAKLAEETQKKMDEMDQRVVSLLQKLASKAGTEYSEEK